MRFWFVVVLGLVWVAGCKREEAPESVASADAGSTVSASDAGSTASASKAPASTVAVPGAASAAPAGHATFVSSSSCEDCHEDEVKAWSHDWHSRALSPGNSKFVAGKF